VPLCRYLAIVDDLDYGTAFAGFAFGVYNLPDVASWWKTVLHHDVTDRRFGVVALRASVAQRRRWVPGDLHAAVRHEPLLGHGDGPLARTPLAQLRIGSF
jgi:hypothetical protein